MLNITKTPFGYDYYEIVYISFVEFHIYIKPLLNKYNCSIEILSLYFTSRHESLKIIRDQD